MKHERQTLIHGWDQDAVSRMRIGIVGCGAIGSAAGHMCTRLGIRSITGIDPDVLEEHNLENQMYDSQDLGLPKTQALGTKLLHIDGSISYLAAQQTIQEAHDLLYDVDIILGCLDNNGSREYLNMQAVVQEKILIDAGIQGMSGTIRTTIPGKTLCMQCWSSLVKPSDVKASCSSEEAIPSTFITAVQAATIQVNQVIKHIHGQEHTPLIAFSLDGLSISTFNTQRNEDCLLCSRYVGVEVNG